MNLVDLLNQIPKTDKTWEQTIAKRDLFFQALVKSSEHDFEEATKSEHLINWYKTFRLKRTWWAEEKSDNLSSQWKHAVKIFICARFVTQNNSKFPAALESDEGKDWLFRNLQDRFEEFSKIASPIEMHGDEVLMLCALFSDKTSATSRIEIPFATAPPTASEAGRIHILELRKVQSFGLVQQNPCVFPGADAYAKHIDSDFRMAIKTAFLLNEKPWEEEGLEEKFGRFGLYGIVWDVKPFYVGAETEKLIDFENRKKKDSTVEPDEDIQKLLDKQYDRTLHGESIGLAAFVGIYRVLRGTYPDKEVLFSARLKVARENGEAVGGICSVAGIPQKIKAAIETNFIDTFVLHEDNFKQHQTGEKSDERQEIERLLKNREHFRLKVLDSDGNKTGVFPPPA